MAHFRVRILPNVFALSENDIFSQIDSFHDVAILKFQTQHIDFI